MIDMNQRFRERFESKFKKVAGCWLWEDSFNRGGYGRFWIGNGKTSTAHRIAYELYKGTIPDGLCVCHSCDVRNCVNPDHLWLGTTQDNTQDRSKKGRTHRHIGNNFCTKLSFKIAAEIRQDFKDGIYYKDIMKKFNIGVGTAYEIKNNRRWVIDDITEK